MALVKSHFSMIHNRTIITSQVLLTLITPSREDPLSQVHIQEGLISNSLHANVAGSEKFHSLPCHMIKLSHLRCYFEGEDIDRYFKAILGKKVDVDASEYISEGASNHAMCIAEHYPDFCLLIPFSEDFRVFLPTNKDTWSWGFQLDLGHHLWPFKAFRDLIHQDQCSTLEGSQLDKLFFLQWPPMTFSPRTSFLLPILLKMAATIHPCPPCFIRWFSHSFAMH